MVEPGLKKTIKGLLDDIYKEYKIGSSYRGDPVFNIECEKLLLNPCGLFDCLDGFFLQFYNINENNESILISQFNYSKINMIQTDEIDFYNNSKDFDDLVGNYLNFSKLLNEKIIKIKKIFFVFFFIII